MRESNRRRCTKSVRPMKHAMPATPPTPIAADADRDPLLEPVRNANRLENPDRRQQTAGMAEEDNQHADVEEIGPPEQLLPAQQLARARAPRILLAVEAQQAPNQKRRKAEVRIPAVDDVIDEIAHDRSSTRRMS